MAEAALKIRERNRFERFYFPKQGPLRRELYTKHMEFFSAGAHSRERLFMAGNRVGKTEGGAYEVTAHLTGRYPDWWEGKRFKSATNWWAAGSTHTTVRDILQAKLIGKPGAEGTAMIPADALIHTTPKAGVPGGVDTAYVRHVSGKTSILKFKSYDQKRRSFEGTEQDGIWLDEEPPLDIYAECLTRTMTTNGLVMITFTPLNGLSDVVLSFMPEGDYEHPVKTMVRCTWDDVPHLDEKAKAELWNSYPPYQRDARRKGIPALGAGAIYPIPEEDIIVPDMEIPKHWPRGYGLDVGWNRTATIWGALNRDTDVLYLYSEHYRGEAEPSVHAAAIRGRGQWMTGTIDPASRGRSQVDGQQLIQMYRDLGLHLRKADNSVESGIYNVWERLSQGRLKVFASLNNWRGEYRLYRRDEKGRIVKERDHLMDATRYLVMELSDVIKVEPVKQSEPVRTYTLPGSAAGGWMS